MHQLKLAFRTLWKTPFVTGVAILSLALGIGANSAIYSLFDQMILRDLPVPAPERLVNLSVPGPKPGSTSCGGAGGCEDVFSYPMFRDLEQDSPVFTGMGAHVSFGANLAFDGQTSSSEGRLVSGGFFSTLGVVPALGRLIGPDDDAVIGQSAVVVLGHWYWQDRFGGRSDIIGETMILNGKPMTIIGVASESFRTNVLGSRPDVYVPLSMRSEVNPGWEGFENRRKYWAYVFARLAPGVSLEQAQATLATKYSTIVREVEAPLQEGMSDATMERFLAKPLVMTSGSRGQSVVHGEARAPLLLLFGVAGVVLMIACANIANLLLARSASRAGEIAVRLSIGAPRRKLVGQLLTESCLLAILGGLASLFVADWTLRFVAQLLPPFASRGLTLSLDTTAMLFAMVLALATGILFGLFPALHSTKPDLATTLKGQAGQPAGARSAARFRLALVTAQIALSTALLVSAGLFLRSLVNVSRVDLGLNVEQLVTFTISPERNGYTPERTLGLFARVEEELLALPGITAVTSSMVPVLNGSNWGTDVRVEGFEDGPDVNTNSRYNEVGPGYFRTMGVALLAGREFTETDTAGAPKVAIVNRAFAEKFGLEDRVIGTRMALSSSDEEDTLDIEIVGLAPDIKYSEVKGAVPPLFFTPYRQDEELGFISFYLRTAGPPADILATIPPVISNLDPNLPLQELKTMPQQVRENIFIDRMLTTFSGAFAVLATVLAAIGLYGVLAYTVSQRLREFGLRMVLGANAGSVRRLVLRQVGTMVLVGCSIGLAAAIGLGSAARSQLFELDGHDPMVLIGATVLLALVALGSGLIPAHRAARVEPMRALRHE